MEAYMETKRSFQKTQRLKKLRDKYVPDCLAHVTPVIAGSASGNWITDVDGNRYLDFGAGIGVLCAGNCHPSVVDAVKAQLDTSFHTCIHIIMQENYILLAERLAKVAPGNFDKKVMFLNSGAEAVENVIKLARLYTKRRGFLASEYGFHGRTFGAMTLTSKTRPHKVGLDPVMAGVYRMPYAYCYRCALRMTYPSCNMACLDRIEEMFATTVPPESIAGIIIEPVLGESGVIVPPKEYIEGLRKICDTYGMVFILDEIQTAFGRVGEMFAADHFGVVPDIMPLAKALGNGVPISAVVGRKEIMDAPAPAALGSTYGGNPIACAAGHAVFDVLEKEKLPDRSKKIGARMLKRFRKLEELYDFVGEVRGIGMMFGIELVKDRESKKPYKDMATRIIKGCVESGLIVLRAGAYGNVIRLLPPLNSPEEDLETGMQIIEQVFSKANEKRP